MHLFEGAFIQLDGRLEQFSQEQWERELSLMNDIGMKLVIIQYSGNGDYTFYPKNEGNDVFSTILKVAEGLGMSVIGGLELPNDWWDGEQDLEQRAKAASAEAEELWNYYGGYEAFAGWYIPHEFDDYRFKDEQYIPQVNGFLRQIAETCHAISKEHSVSMAPYFIKYMEPDEFAAWWTKVLDGSGIDIMMLQDGVGCRRTDNQTEAPLYYEAMAQACAAAGVEFWSDIEVFHQIHGMPVDNERWAAVPASIERVMEQIRVQSPYVTKTVIFDFSHYMSPQYSAEAEKLYLDYQKILKDSK